MQVAYSIQETPGKGKGIFASMDINKGDLVWCVASSHHHIFSSSLDAKAIMKDEYKRVLEVAVGHISIPNQILYLYDDSQYFNHSESPNCGPIEDKQNDFTRLSLIAVKDIKIGEEMTENYMKYSFPLWFLEELQKYDMVPLYCDLPLQNLE